MLKLHARDQHVCCRLSASTSENWLSERIVESEATELPEGPSARRHSKAQEAWAQLVLVDVITWLVLNGLASEVRSSVKCKFCVPNHMLKGAYKVGGVGVDPQGFE